MGLKLPPKQLQLYQAIDQILFNDWDPCGVSGVAEARDEYHGYLPQVFELALSGDPTKIAEYLDRVVTERMGLDSNMKAQLAIATYFGRRQTLAHRSIDQRYLVPFGR